MGVHMTIVVKFWNASETTNLAVECFEIHFIYIQGLFVASAEICVKIFSNKAVNKIN